MSTLKRARDEVEALHDALEAWISGAADVEDWGPRVAARFSQAVRYVLPNGEVLYHGTVLASLKGAHGANPDFRIRVQDVELVAEAPGVVVVTYVEWQRGARQAIRPNNARRSTVVFEDDGERLRWRHLHEGWVPAAMMDGGDFSF